MPDWEALYQAEDTGWDRGAISPALETWLALGSFREGARILVPGCGRGYEVIELARRGFEVTALDLAPSAVAALESGLEQAGVTAAVKCVDIFNHEEEAPFDMVYEQTCLCAIEPIQRQAYEQCMARWLKTGGTLLLSMMQTGELSGPPYHCELLEMKALFHPERWSWEEQPPFVIPRGQQSARFELGFTLKRKGEK